MSDPTTFPFLACSLPLPLLQKKTPAGNSNLIPPSINVTSKSHATPQEFKPTSPASLFPDATSRRNQMGRRLGLTSLFFKPRDTSRSSSYFSSPPSLSYSWPWPSCKHPKTLSFRAADGDDIYKTVNSVYVCSTESCFTHSSEELESFSTASEDSGSDSLETVIRGLRSDRLFFEPGDTSSILEEAKTGAFSFKKSIVLAMESEDPYHDFRVSMEEMVVAHGLKDWECLEELLLWYLRVNAKKTHGFIVGAFVDLLLGLASPPSYSSSSSMSFEIEELENEGNRSC